MARGVVEREFRIVVVSRDVLRSSSLRVASLSEGVAEPFQPFIETVTGGGAGGLDILTVISTCQPSLTEHYSPRRVGGDYVDQACR